ncbi:MAG: HAD family phosphatase [Oscillospiraceae bacterium]|nr:HAD family phosphatase [Oscillospiraceae bacterium]
MFDILNIKAAVLDMDGTLIDSMGIWHQIDKDFFAEHNLTPPEGISNQVNKMTMEEWADFFTHNFNINMTGKQVIRRIGEMAYAYYAEKIPLKPYVIEFLDFLDSRNIRYGIATATYKKSAIAALKRLGIFDRMQFILTAEEVPSSKKTPEMFLKAAEILGSQTENTLVVEDSLHCLETAVKAGFPTIAVHDNSVPMQEQEKIKSLAGLYGLDLKEILEKINPEQL